jgi:hypothetical protein
MKRIAFFTLAIVWVSAGLAQLEYKGVPLGTSKTDLLARHPTLVCKATPQSFKPSIGEEHCTEAFMCTTPACVESRKVLGTYGGAPAWGANFGIVDGKVERFGLSIASRSYAQVRDALREVHGAGTEEQRVLQSRTGAALQSRTWTANSTAGTIFATEHAGKVDEGSVGAASAAFIAWREERAREAPKKNSKDL